MTLANEAEAHAQARQSVELRQRARDDQVVVLLNQRSDIGCIHRDEAGISFVDEYHRVRRDVLHDATNLLRGQAVTCGVVGRSEQQHTRMNAVGVLNHLVDIVGEGVFLFVQGIHLERAATLRGYTVVVPPGELRNQYLLVVANHQEIVDGILQHVFAAIGQQHLILRHTVDLTQADGDDALLALVVDAGVEAQRLGVEILDGLHHFLAGLKIKFVSVEIVHNLYIFYLLILNS